MLYFVRTRVRLRADNESGPCSKLKLYFSAKQSIESGMPSKTSTFALKRKPRGKDLKLGGG